MEERQVGGKLLGKGVYGCTFEPAPRCAGGKVFKTVAGLPAVGKITVEDGTAELGIGRALMGLPIRDTRLGSVPKNLPLAPQYFALPMEECRPELPIQDPDVSRCDVLNDKDTKEADIDLLIMPNAGLAFSKWALDLPRLADQYVRVFTHLLEGMIVYQGAGYVHNDIHYNNVVVDRRGVARYIDFGLGFRVADVKTWADANLGTGFKPKYVWMPPEVHAWRMYKSGVRLRDGVAQLKEINPEYSEMETRFPERVRAMEALSDLLQETQSKSSGEFVRTYAKQFDWWRIGLLMWMAWDDLLGWRDFMSTPLWSRRAVIRRILGGMTEFDPRRRMSPVVALRLLEPGNRMAVH